MHGFQKNLLYTTIIYNLILVIKGCDFEKLMNITTYNYIKKTAKWEPMDFDDNIFKSVNIAQARHYYLGI